MRQVLREVKREEGIRMGFKEHLEKVLSGREMCLLIKVFQKNCHIYGS